MRVATSGWAARMARRRCGCGRIGSACRKCPISAPDLSNRHVARFLCSSIGSNWADVRAAAIVDLWSAHFNRWRKDWNWTKSPEQSTRIQIFTLLWRARIRRQILHVNAMHFVDPRTGELDWPAHAEIIFENPAEFDMLDFVAARTAP